MRGSVWQDSITKEIIVKAGISNRLMAGGERMIRDAIVPY
jgi:hypothetical protein